MSDHKQRSKRWSQRNAALDAIIKKAGGPKKVAAALGTTPGAVSQWRKVPPNRALQVAELAKVPVSRLQTDVLIPASMARKLSAANGPAQAPEKTKS